VLFVPRAARLRAVELVVDPEGIVRERLPTDPPPSAFMLYDLEGELFFGAAPELDRCFAEITHRAESQKIAHVILRLKRVRNPDVVCLERLEHFLRTSEENKLTVRLAGVRPDLVDAFGRLSFAEWISPDHIFKQGPDDDSATLAAIRATYDHLRGDKSWQEWSEEHGSPASLSYQI
jgi:SulP family sulfate permease